MICLMDIKHLSPNQYISMQNKIVEMYLKIAIECPDKDLGYYLD